MLRSEETKPHSVLSKLPVFILAFWRQGLETAIAPTFPVLERQVCATMLGSGEAVLGSLVSPAQVSRGSQSCISPFSGLCVCGQGSSAVITVGRAEWHGMLSTH